MIAFNIIDYAIVIVLLFTLLPFIEKMIDFIGWIVIGLTNDIGRFIIYLTNGIGNLFFNSVKLVVRGSLYYLIALVYIYWIALIINIISNVFNSHNFNFTHIYDIALEEQNNLMNKVYGDVYKNYTL
jgi:hypothetical protein